MSKDPAKRNPLRCYVYVVALADAARKRADEFLKGAVYVGRTCLTPEERFANHKRGHKASSVVKKHGLRLIPELQAGPLTYDGANLRENELALALRLEGYEVFGGH